MSRAVAFSEDVTTSDFEVVQIGAALVRRVEGPGVPTATVYG